jgi:hypothetical protein
MDGNRLCLAENRTDDPHIRSNPAMFGKGIQSESDAARHNPAENSSAKNVSMAFFICWLL